MPATLVKGVRHHVSGGSENEERGIEKTGLPDVAPENEVLTLDN